MRHNSCPLGPATGVLSMARSPLDWDLPNCVITPHDSGFSPLSLDRTLKFFLDDLGRLRRGEPLLNEVRADE